MGNIRGLRQRAGALAILVALASLLAACGSAQGQTSSGSSGHPTLACVSVIGGQGIDTIAARLTCKVTGATASDTSFQLQYRVTDSGNHLSYSAVCAGELHNGAGSCTQTYVAPVPLSITPASVSGHAEPSNQTLGPVTPTEHDATPAPNQHL